MRRMSACIFFCFLITHFAQSQQNSQWEVIGTHVYDYMPGSEFHLLSDSRYVANNLGFEIVIDEIQSISRYFFPQYENPDPNSGTRFEDQLEGTIYSRWMNNTLITQIVPYTFGGPMLSCERDDQTRFVLYDVSTRSSEEKCLKVPPGSLERSPFNEEIVLVDHQYLVDIITGEVQDLASTLPSQVEMEHLEMSVAHGTVWWDSQSHLPVALVRPDRVLTEGEEGHQLIVICPLLNNTCTTLVDTGVYIYGYLDEVIIAPDGQTVLWTATEFKPDEKIEPGAPLGLIQDVLAFSTDVQTGVTVPLLRLSAYGVGLGTVSDWAPDGQTLAIRLARSGLESDGSINGLFIAHFHSPAST